MKTRSIRRHYRTRNIKKFERLTSNWYLFGTEEDHKHNVLRMAGRGSIGCGCMLCANPRKSGMADSKYTRKELENLHYFHNWPNEY